MKRIPLTRGKEAIVDDEDYDYLTQWKWFITRGYAARQGPRSKIESRKHVLMHRVIARRAGFRVADVIDHKDGDCLNNRRTNLRSATNAQNAANRGPTKRNTSGYKGVIRCRSKWLATIMVSRQRLYLGCFDSKHDAARAYNVAALKYFGDFAYQNPVGQEN